MSNNVIQNTVNQSALLQKKICMLGEFSVGKTSLVRRFVEGSFSDTYLSTIGAKLSRKKVTVGEAEQTQDMMMLIWDLVGGEKFDHMMSSYFRGAAGAILVCDLTRLGTLNALSRYSHDFWRIRPQAPLVIIGNKADLIDQIVATPDDLAGIAEPCKTKFFISSAKTGQNVEEAFRFLGARLLVEA